MTKAIPNLSERDNISAAEYALGVTQGKARAEFARRLEQEPLLAAAVRSWDEQFVAFTDDIASVTPPSSVETALQNRLFPSQQKASLWNSLGLWRGLTVASLAVAIAMGAWSIQPSPESNALVAQISDAQNTLKLVAYYDAQTGELRLNRAEGAPASGRSHEVWLIAGNDAPVSLGVLQDVATARVIVPQALRGKFAKGIIAISDEPAGGSTTGAPTGAVLGTGALTEI